MRGGLTPFADPCFDDGQSTYGCNHTRPGMCLAHAPETVALAIRPSVHGCLGGGWGYRRRRCLAWIRRRCRCRPGYAVAVAAVLLSVVGDAVMVCSLVPYITSTPPTSPIPRKRASRMGVLDAALVRL